MSVKLHDLLERVKTFPGTFPRFVLPDGDYIPAHAHVTEVGHVLKNFIDCGGERGKTESVLLQTHVGNDTSHRLRSDRFATILELGSHVGPTDQLEVEVEYDCCVVSQYPVEQVKRAGEHLDIVLGRKKTQCLAQERRRQDVAGACCAEAARSCC